MTQARRCPMMSETLCGATFHDSPFACTRESGHAEGSKPGTLRNKFVRQHIAKDDNGIVQMMWNDEDVPSPTIPQDV